MSYPMTMTARTSSAPRIFAPLLGLAMMATPGYATSGAQARLVHCGNDTCLRISGHRVDPAVAIRIGGDDLVVEGGRNWRVTVPLTTARVWAGASGSVVTLILADAQEGTESRATVALPTGAFGRRVELASLVVSAH